MIDTILATALITFGVTGPIMFLWGASGTDDPTPPNHTNGGQ